MNIFETIYNIQNNKSNIIKIRDIINKIISNNIFSSIELNEIYFTLLNHKIYNDTLYIFIKYLYQYNESNNVNIISNITIFKDIILIEDNFDNLIDIIKDYNIENINIIKNYCYYNNYVTYMLINNINEIEKIDNNEYYYEKLLFMSTIFRPAHLSMALDIKCISSRLSYMSKLLYWKFKNINNKIKTFNSILTNDEVNYNLDIRYWNDIMTYIDTEHRDKILGLILLSNNEDIKIKANEILHNTFKIIYDDENNSHYFEITDFFINDIKNYYDNLENKIDDCTKINDIIQLHLKYEDITKNEIFKNNLITNIFNVYKFNNDYKLSILDIIYFCYTEIYNENNKNRLKEFVTELNEIMNRCIFGIVSNILIFTNINYLKINDKYAKKDNILNELRSIYPNDDDIWQDVDKINLIIKNMLIEKDLYFELKDIMLF